MINSIRETRSTINGCELDCRVHAVRRIGDAGHAVVSIDAVNSKGRRVWTSGRMAVLLDTINGTTPTLRGRTESASRRLRNLRMALSGRMHSLCYWVDSSAHFWCADNAPHLYARESA